MAQLLIEEVRTNSRFVPFNNGAHMNKGKQDD